MLCCQWFLTLLLIYYVVSAPTVSAQQDEDKPVKYAPNYCLRFRFNCDRPEKKSHVCCLYPQNPNPSGGSEKRPSPNYGTAVKFRPVKLPKTKPKKTEDEQDEQEKDQDGRKKPSASLKNLKKGRPEFNPSNAGGAIVKKPLQKIKSNLKSKSKTRPRICKRLVVNCKKNSGHRCCQYQDVAPAIDVVKPEVEIPEVDPTPPPGPPPPPAKPETSDNVAVNAPKEVVKGEVEVVDLEIPVVVEAQNKFAKIVNGEVGVGAPKNEPYQRIPAECFTESFDCDQDPDNKCCAILDKK